MTTIFLIAGVLIFISAIVLLFCALNAPDGHEDTEGFHDDGPKNSLWQQRRMVESGRQSHFLNI
jgi:hypothetical protein